MVRTCHHSQRSDQPVLHTGHQGAGFPQTTLVASPALHPSPAPHCLSAGHPPEPQQMGKALLRRTLGASSVLGEEPGWEGIWMSGWLLLYLGSSNLLSMAPQTTGLTEAPRRWLPGVTGN